MLPEADRALEETRLLGSIVGAGVAERVFELEADAGGDDRRAGCSKCDLNGPFMFPALHGLSQRTIEIRGKADRIDVLADGTLRVVDYKLGRMPDLERRFRSRSTRTARVRCSSGRRPARIRVASAMYLAFGDDRRLEGALGGAESRRRSPSRRGPPSLPRRSDEIEAGEFPPRPKRPSECQWCRYAGVCRKEYQIEDDGCSRACLTRGRARRPADRRPIRRRASLRSIRRNDVVLEASAGTGKTRVLVDRYVRLIEAGVEPRHILAITFTRKAAAEMRERVLAELRRRAAAGRIAASRLARDLRIASPTFRSPRSTRSVSACCASSRSKPTSIRRSRSRTRPRWRGSPTRRWT